MNEIELNDLIARAEKVRGGEMPVIITNGQQTIGSAQGIGEDGGSKSYQIDGILQSPDGDKIRKSLKVIVNYFESKVE
jgi:hypothetical protein